MLVVVFLENWQDIFLERARLHRDALVDKCRRVRALMPHRA